MSRELAPAEHASQLYDIEICSVPICRPQVSSCRAWKERNRARMVGGAHAGRRVPMSRKMSLKKMTTGGLGASIFHADMMLGR